MKHFILFYDYVADYIDRRAALRPAHLAHINASVERDELQLGGAMTDKGPPMAVLVFKAETRETAETFAMTDPNVTGGLVTSWRVREWTTVAGRDALTKV